MKALRLVSPPSTGPDVRHAQTLLKTNRFQKDYLQSKVDGVFGEATARACKRAKFWCGYPDNKIQPTFGTTLEALLAGKAKLPDAYATRRKQRVTAAARKPIREKALARAITQIGVTEHPADSNDTLYGAWYGLNGEPWCAIFVTWNFVLEGSTAFSRGHRWSYVPWIVAAARAGNYGLSITHSPLPGDLPCYDWDDDGTPDHIGFLEHMRAGGNFTAVEGNTAIGNNSNGGKVMRRTDRHTSEVEAFVHVAR